MSIAIFIAAALLFFFSLAVRFAGSSQILNFVEYAKVRDRPALHAWVGHRLLGLSAISAVLGVVALRSPAIAIFCLLSFVVAVLVAVSWLTVGAGRFHVSAS
ncbi:MAG: hypothetical protein JNN30_09550 [Rhodanobacteraceae bacterium]|nr:hypothetical protein [Rhodanobacteraceae bacterium]